MSKKRAPKTAAPFADADTHADPPADVYPAVAAHDPAVSPLNPVTNTVQSGASVEAALDSSDSAQPPEGKKNKKSKRDKKDETAKASDGDKKEKREKKDKGGKKRKKEKAAKAVEAKQDRGAKRDKPKGKKNKSTAASELRPLRKVNVLLIEPNGQPRAHFDGEIGVLDLLLPKAEGDATR